MKRTGLHPPPPPPPPPKKKKKKKKKNIEHVKCTMQIENIVHTQRRICFFISSTGARAFIAFLQKLICCFKPNNHSASCILY